MGWCRCRGRTPDRTTGPSRETGLKWQPNFEPWATRSVDNSRHNVTMRIIRGLVFSSTRLSVFRALRVDYVQR